jgi:hypothetical protein
MRLSKCCKVYPYSKNSILSDFHSVSYSLFFRNFKPNGMSVEAAIAVYYYVNYKPPSMSDWITEGVEAGCTTTAKNEYGIPTSFICPSGVIENITVEKI